MKYFILFISLLLFSSCNIAMNQDSPVKTKDPNDASHEGAEKDLSGFQRDTFTINGQKLIQLRKDNQFFCMTFLSGDTIIKFYDYYIDLNIDDMNRDGFQDLQVNAESGLADQCVNYFFDPVRKTYHFIKNSHTHLFYLIGCDRYISMSRGECKGLRWYGLLSKIVNWEQTDIGTIDIKRCGKKDDGIIIYKIKNGSQVLYKQLPLSLLKGDNNELLFMKDFWYDHYKEFEN